MTLKTSDQYLTLATRSMLVLERKLVPMALLIFRLIYPFGVKGNEDQRWSNLSLALILKLYNTLGVTLPIAERKDILRNLEKNLLNGPYVNSVEEVTSLKMLSPPSKEEWMILRCCVVPTLMHGLDMNELYDYTFVTLDPHLNMESRSCILGNKIFWQNSMKILMIAK